MATTAHPVQSETQDTPLSREQALSTLVDLFEDALEKMTPEKRKTVLDDLSATAEKLDKRA